MDAAPFVTVTLTPAPGRTDAVQESLSTNIPPAKRSTILLLLVRAALMVLTEEAQQPSALMRPSGRIG